MVFKAYPEEQKDLRWVTVSLTTLATILLMCRLTTTLNHRGWLGLEDAFVIAANVFLILLAAFIYTSTIYGFGMRVADIERTGGDVTKALKCFWLSQFFYTLTNGCNKMAFLTLYYRIFPMKRFRLICKALMAVSVGWTVSFFFVSIFQCTPVPRVYNRAIPGTCINFFWHRWSHAVLNLLTDISIFVLPIPVIFRLKMSISSRISLVVVFSMGFFICITTALRMVTLPLTLRAKEPTWESAPTNLWSFIEVATGVICACLISLRKSISVLWPKRWRSQKGTSSRQYQQYGSGEPNGFGMPQLRNRTENCNASSYSLNEMKSGGKARPDMYPSISPSESQERIIEDMKTQVHGKTSRTRSESGSGSGSGSDDVTVQGITIRTDIEVVRD